MTSDGAEKLVVASLLVAGTVTTIADLAEGHRPSLGLPIALTVAGVLLAGLSDFAPDLAGGFAILLMIGALLRTSAKSLPAIGKAVAIK